MRGVLKSGLLIALLAVGQFQAAMAADLMGNPDESWDPGPSESHFGSMAEERFQMECHYLGIKGERKDQVRKLFEGLMKARKGVIRSRDSGELTRKEAIARLDGLDVKYYLSLKDEVRGRRHLDRLERMIEKARGRNSEDISVLSEKNTGRKPGH